MSEDRDQPAAPIAFADPSYATGVVDLLGVLAYGELTAFERLAEDAAMAPTTADKAALAAMASAEFGHFTALRDRLEKLDVDPYAAMAPFSDSFDRFHAHTAPADWLESLVKAYVGDGLAADFYREVAAFLDADTRDLIMTTLDDTGHSAFVVDRVRRAIADDPTIGGRLALWGRRLVGEALSQAQVVVAEHDGLSAVLTGSVDRPGMDLAAIGRMFARLTENHAARMASLGLAS
ncbi:MAG: ferritin-like fold-containing protein [Nocardioidaceae bacterium]